MSDPLRVLAGNFFEVLLQVAAQKIPLALCSGTKLENMRILSLLRIKTDLYKNVREM